MSYILKIWEPPGQPQPADVAAVEAAVEALESGAPRPSIHFDPLVQRLTRRYPDITSAAAQEVPESEWAWSSGPLAGTKHTVLVLGLRKEKIGEVLPFVVQQVAALPLAVLDPQAGAAWLPGGVHVGVPLAEAKRPVHAEAGGLPERSDAAFQVFDALAPLLAAPGFKASRSRRLFKRALDGGWQEVILMVPPNTS